MERPEVQHRYFLQLSYHGSHYHGWQLQPNAPTIQAEVNQTLSTLLREETETTGAGRTDAGVHARYYIAHFDTGRAGLHEDPSFLYKCNALLPQDIAVHRLISVSPSAHARFDALSRTYEYVLTTRKDPFLERLSWLYHQEPDLQQLNHACKMLLGSKDFSSFSKLHTDVSTHHCNVTEASWHASQGVYIFTITADRFLRNMVRAIVGTMMEVGLHKITLEQFRKIIEKKDRSVAGPSAPPQGLFLTHIDYPETVLTTNE